METPYRNAVDAYMDVADNLRSIAQAIVDEEGSRGIGKATIDGPESIAIDYLSGRKKPSAFHCDGYSFSFRSPRNDLTDTTPLDAIESLFGAISRVEEWYEQATGKALGGDLRSDLLYNIGRADCTGETPDIEGIVHDLESFPSHSVIEAYLSVAPSELPQGVREVYTNNVTTVHDVCDPYALVGLDNDRRVLITTETAERPFIAYVGEDGFPAADSFTVDDVRVALGFDVDGASKTVTADEPAIGERYGYLENAAVRALGKLVIRCNGSAERYIKTSMISEEQREQIQRTHSENATALLEDLDMTDVADVTPHDSLGASFEIAADDSAVRRAASDVLDIRTPASMRNNANVDLEDRTEALETLLLNWLRDQYDLIRKEHQLQTVNEFENERAEAIRTEDATDQTVSVGQYSISIPKVPQSFDEAQGIPVLEDCEAKVSHPFYGVRKLKLPAGLYTFDRIPAGGGYRRGTWDVDHRERKDNELLQ